MRYSFNFPGFEEARNNLTGARTEFQGQDGALFISEPADSRGRKSQQILHFAPRNARPSAVAWISTRSEEHTSELQSRLHLVCRLLLEKKNKITDLTYDTERRSDGR